MVKRETQRGGGEAAVGIARQSALLQARREVAAGNAEWLRRASARSRAVATAARRRRAPWRTAGVEVCRYATLPRTAFYAVCAGTACAMSPRAAV